MTNEKTSKKTCFVIAPIGEEGSKVRQRSDDVLNYIIKPIVSGFGYKAIRADGESKPGVITSQIIQHIIEDDIVIADLTDENPNVFYELAIRHAIKKPYIQITQSQGQLPFDVASIRTIYFDAASLGSVEDCKQELISQIKAIEQDPTNIDSPISMAINLLALRKSDNLVEKSNAEILAMLQDILNTVNEHSRILSAINSMNYKYQSTDSENLDRILQPASVMRAALTSEISDLFLSMNRSVLADLRPTLFALKFSEDGLTLEELSQKTRRRRSTERNFLGILIDLGIIKEVEGGEKIKFVLVDRDLPDKVFRA